MGDYFSVNSASRDSQFLNLPHNISNSDDVNAVIEEIKAHGEDYDRLISLGVAYNYQLRYREAIDIFSNAISLDSKRIDGYRMRAPRYINTLQFDKAYEDYIVCNEIQPNSLDIVYRLGLAQFYKRDFEGAKKTFEDSYQLIDSGEMDIAVLYWHTITCCKLGISPTLLNHNFLDTMDVGHHTAYMTAMRLFMGRNSFGATLEIIDATEDDHMEYATAMYGVCMYLDHLGDEEKSAQCYKLLLAHDGFWPCFAYIAAYIEK